MNSSEFHILSHKFDNLQKEVTAKINEIDENKNIKKEYDDFKVRYQRLENNYLDLETKRNNLQEKVDELKQELQQQQEKEIISNKTPVLRGKQFEKENNEVLKYLCRAEGNSCEDTSAMKESADNIVIIQGFKVVIDHKNTSPKVQVQKGGENCYIDEKDVLKIQRDAKVQCANAAILVYPKLDNYNGFYHMKNEYKCDSAVFDKNMMIACTPDRIAEALLTLIALNDHSKLTISVEKKQILEKMTLICKMLGQFVKPFCQSFSISSGETVNDWGANLGKLIHSLSDDCCAHEKCDKDLIEVQNMIKEALEPLWTKHKSVFMKNERKDSKKRSINDDDERQNKKMKLDEMTNVEMS